MSLLVLCTKQSGRLNVKYGLPRKLNFYAEMSKLAFSPAPAPAVTNYNCDIIYNYHKLI